MGVEHAAPDAIRHAVLRHCRLWSALQVAVHVQNAVQALPVPPVPVLLSQSCSGKPARK